MKKRVGLIALLLTLAIAVCGFVGCSLFDKADSLKISRYPDITYRAGEDLTGTTFMKVVLTKDGKDIALELKFKDANTLVGEADGKTYTFEIANFDISTAGDTTRTATISYDTLYATFQYNVIEKTKFLIYDATDLNNFRDAVNRGDADYIAKDTVVELMADITLDGPWIPISNYYRSTKVYEDKVNGKYTRDETYGAEWFKGEFDGNGHSISGLTNVNLDYSKLAGSLGTNQTSVEDTLEINYGLFGCVNGANIHDVKFENVNIVNPNATFKYNVGEVEKTATIVGDAVGAVAGFSWENSVFENIIVNGSVAGYDDVGGIVGMVRAKKTNGVMNDVTVRLVNCEVNATVTAIRRAGGVVGQSNVAKPVFEGCKVTNTVLAAQSDKDTVKGASAYYTVGGIATFNGKIVPVIKNCVVAEGLVKAGVVEAGNNGRYGVNQDHTVVYDNVNA